ncbi:hypothetical protein F4808DRAFT_451714 [Astrocystis sublimbata]|nr:hypothetical protein F4808DRAFT_451714 [Astrocystis sublimbata]
MYHSTGVLFVASAILASFPYCANSQQSRWVPNQVSATMCAWKAFRAAQLKDTAFLDGGFLYWTAGLADGSSGRPTQDGNPLGLTYTLNFSVPFDSNTNVSEILGIKSFDNAAANIKPNYYDGAMLANDHEFFLYGGLLANTKEYSPPDADDVLYYRDSDYGVPKPAFKPSFANGQLPDNFTRYVTYGGAANAPSENKAWYFGGSRSPSWGPIFQPSINGSLNPSEVADTLITLDLSVSQSEKWSNVTLPSKIPGRANPSVVWVPVGKQGILVVLGGVAYPEYSTGFGASDNPAQSEKVSPGYMSNIDIYDVESGEWYQQSTSGAPSQRAVGCAVVASAQDSSSHNIYYYGGFDGLHETTNFFDEVWVLSLPSFTWTMLSPGKNEHARAYHQCLTPYPDQMVTIGGSRHLPGQDILCLGGGILQVFNLTQGEWLSSYDPAKWDKYGVPTMIQDKIGGDYSGGATVTTPTPSGWGATQLADIFGQKYNTSKITTYYPYKPESSGNGTRGSWDGGSGGGGGGGTPSWVPPVLGVVLGLVFLTAIAVGILLYRRRSLLRKRQSETTGSGTETDERRHYIRTWLNNNNAEKAPTVTTDDPSSRDYDMRSRNETPLPPGTYVRSPTPEMTQDGMKYEMPPDHQRFELGDTSKAAELDDQALSYNDVLTKHTQLHSPTSPHSRTTHNTILQSSSFYTGSVSQEQPSSLTSSQAGINPATAAAAMAHEQVESPLLGHPNPYTRTPPPGNPRDTMVSPMQTPPPPTRNAVVSDVSRISDRHLAHLRNLSGNTVSSSSNMGPSPPNTPPVMHAAFVAGPVSPPLPSPPSADSQQQEARDYVSMEQSVSPIDQRFNNAPPVGPGGRAAGRSGSASMRASVFRENSDDLGDKPSKSSTQ